MSVKAWEMITVGHVKKSFETTGMWPVDHRFLNVFPSRKEKVCVDAQQPLDYQIYHGCYCACANESEISVDSSREYINN